MENIDNLDDLFAKMSKESQNTEDKYNSDYKGKPGYSLPETVDGFICLSFELPMKIKNEFIDFLSKWEYGDIRGYINEYEILCINIPVPADLDEEEEFWVENPNNIYQVIKNLNQAYFDMESSNLGCWLYPFPYYKQIPTQIIDPTIDLRKVERDEQKDPEFFKQIGIIQFRNIKELIYAWNEIIEMEK